MAYRLRVKLNGITTVPEFGDQQLYSVPVVCGELYPINCYCPELYD